MSDAPSRRPPNGKRPDPATDSDDKTLVTDFDALVAEMAKREAAREPSRPPRRATQLGQPVTRPKSRGGWATTAGPPSPVDPAASRKRDPTLAWSGAPPGMASRAPDPSAPQAPLADADDMTMPLGSLTAAVREHIGDLDIPEPRGATPEPPAPARTKDLGSAVRAARAADAKPDGLVVTGRRGINTLASPKVRPNPRPTTNLRQSGSRDVPEAIDIVQARPPHGDAGKPRGQAPRVRPGSAPRVKSPRLQPVEPSGPPTPNRKRPPTRHLKRPDEPVVPEPVQELQVPQLEPQRTLVGVQEDKTGPGIDQKPASRPARTVRPAPPLLGRLTLLVLLLLFEAMVLPGFHDGGLTAPWSDLLRPGSPTSVATAFFVLVLVALLIPMRPIWRATALSVLGLALAVFSLALFGAAVSGGAFDDQPALEAVFDQGVVARVVLVLALFTTLVGLFWRRTDLESLGARIVAITGLALCVFCYLALQLTGALDAMPLVGLASELGGSAFVGDRIAAAVAYLPLVVAPATLLVFRRAPATGGTGLVAMALWAAALLPLFLLALFVAPSAEWHRVLAPLEVTSVLAAGLLLLPLALGHLLGILSAR